MNCKQRNYTEIKYILLIPIPSYNDGHVEEHKNIFTSTYTL